MAKVTVSKKACSVNPLKMSQPIGGALAYMGVRGAMPLLHGSQGCTSFGLVLFVRHFKEAIPLQTTAMSEVATVLGGLENVEQAILNIYNKAKPEIIGICSTGVTETKGDDVEGYLKLIREKYPQLADFPMVYVSTPDFKDAFQDGWEKTVARMVEVLVKKPEADAPRDPKRVNVLPGCHLTPGDLDELRTILEDFGLQPTFLPDLAGSLDGHIPDDFTPTTIGGTGLPEIRTMGSAGFTIAVGDHMHAAAEAMETKTGVPYAVFDRLTGLTPNDELLALLARLSSKPIPEKFRRQRSQLGLPFEQRDCRLGDPAGKAKAGRADTGAHVERPHVSGSRSGDGGRKHHSVEPGAVAAARLQDLQGAAEEGVVGRMIGRAGAPATGHLTIHCPRSASSRRLRAFAQLSVGTARRI